MNPTEVYYNVSRTQMSIARHYGGLKVDGSMYEYDAETDRLIRSDIAARGKKLKKAERKESNRITREMEHAKQGLML